MVGSKGLNSLLSEAKEKSGTVGILKEIPVRFLFPIENQDRKHYDPDALEVLAASFKQRISENKLPNVEALNVYRESDERYLIEGGERRWRAAKLINYDGPLLCQVSYSTDKNELSDIMFLSNFGREDLNAIDLSNALGDRIDCGMWDRQKAMSMTGMNKSTLSKILRLRELPEDVQKLCIDGVRSDKDFLIELGRLADQQRQEYVRKLNDGSFTPDDHAKMKKDLVQAPTASGQKKTEPATSRKPTKLSLKAAALRIIVEHSSQIRKAMKAECQAGHKHSALDSLTDGEFVEIFAASMASWVPASDGIDNT